MVVLSCKKVYRALIHLGCDWRVISSYKVRLEPVLFAVDSVYHDAWIHVYFPLGLPASTRTLLAPDSPDFGCHYWKNLGVYLRFHVRV